MRKSAGDSKKDLQIFLDWVKKELGLPSADLDRDLAFYKARLSLTMAQSGCSSFQELVAALQKDQELYRKVVNQVTTHTTSFFREEFQFDSMSRWIDQKKYGPEPLRIWCAAVSTGQEIYTLLHCLRLSHPKVFQTMDCSLATDVDVKSLEFAARAVYQNQIPGLVDRLGDSVVPAAHGFRMAKSIRDKVHFARLNLTHFPYSLKTKFHVILCRNVLIYFDTSTTQSILKSLVGRLHRGGLLIVGSSESGHVRVPGLEPMEPGIFVKTKELEK